MNNDCEVWLGDGEGGGDDDDRSKNMTGNGNFFNMPLRPEADASNFHVLNAPGQKQRETISTGGQTRKSAFYVRCEAKAIVHGTLDPATGQRATLLVYDVNFVSFRPTTRIKNATIEFEYRPKRGSTSSGPGILKQGPDGEWITMRTERADEATWASELSAGGNFLGAELGAKIGREQKRSQTTSDHAGVAGCPVWDTKGFKNRTARWSLYENASQKSGVPSRLRTCVLLKRDDDEEFDMIPSVKATPDLATWVGSLFYRREVDDPVVMDPKLPPWNVLEGVVIDSSNLGSVHLSLGRLWDCTFQGVLGSGTKSGESRVDTSADERPLMRSVPGGGVEMVLAKNPDEEEDDEED